MLARVSLVISILAALAAGSLACSSSPGASPSDGGPDAFVCTDTAGSSAIASIDDIFNQSFGRGIGPGLLCPLDASPTNPKPLSYDMAMYTNCSTLQMTSGDVQYGQCLDYLVWQVDLDSSGNNFSKCFYDVKTRALVGVIYADGTQDQCGNASYTIQAGTVETCTISGLSSGGGGSLFEDCAPKPDSGGG
jgi:hypothetical protein